MSVQRKIRVYAVGLLCSACAQVGYVPLSDVSIDQEVQKNHRETKKFLQKGLRAENSQLPSGDKFMVKGLKKKPSKLPPGDKLHSMKKKVSSANKKKYKNPKGSKGG
jgi:hypothetical protein